MIFKIVVCLHLIVKGQVAIAVDFKQLGPVISSRYIKVSGLSIIDLLIYFPLYLLKGSLVYQEYNGFNLKTTNI